MATRKPAPVFEVHFDGEQIYPEGIPLRTMSDALSAARPHHLRLLPADLGPTDQPAREPSAPLYPIEGVRRPGPTALNVTESWDFAIELRLQTVLAHRPPRRRAG